jgi:hypothetical protein
VEEFNDASNDADRDSLADKMMNNIIIAHGTTTQTALENAPRGGFRQYESVMKTRKSDQGGVRPRAWLDLFGRALMLEAIQEKRDEDCSK